MRAATRLAAKDLRVSVRTRSIFIIGFVAPLSIAFVMNLVFGGTNDNGTMVTFDVGLVVADNGPIAAEFAAVADELDATDSFDVTHYDNEAAARAAVDDGEVAGAWVIPPGFSDAVVADTGASIIVIGDIDTPTTETVLRSVADSFATAVGTGLLATQTGIATGVVPIGDADDFASEVANAPRLVTIRSIETASVTLDATTTTMAGMAIFFVYFTAGLPVLGLLRERDDGTLARLMAAPISTTSIVAGKVAAGIVIGVGSLVALMIASTILMGASWGPPLGALLLACAAVVAATGIMSIPGAVTRTAEQAGNAQAIVAVTFGLIGGSFVPLPGTEQGLLRALTYITPNQWFVEGLGQLQAHGIAAALPAVGVLLILGAVGGTIGLLGARSVLAR